LPSSASFSANYNKALQSEAGKEADHFLAFLNVGAALVAALVELVKRAGLGGSEDAITNTRQQHTLLGGLLAMEAEVVQLVLFRGLACTQHLNPYLRFHKHMKLHLNHWIIPLVFWTGAIAQGEEQAELAADRALAAEVLEGMRAPHRLRQHPALVAPEGSQAMLLSEALDGMGGCALLPCRGWRRRSDFHANKTKFAMNSAAAYEI